MGFTLGISTCEAPWEVGKIVNETQNLFLWLLEKKAKKKKKKFKQKDPITNPIQIKKNHTSNLFYLNQQNNFLLQNYHHLL